MTPPGQGPAAKDSHWNRGSLLLGETVDALAAAGVLPKHWAGQGCAAVVSHPCDIAADIGVEPDFELILARPVKQPDGNYRYGKSSRTLHLDSEIDGDMTTLEMSIHDRAQVPREDLEQPEGQLDQEAARLIARWVSRRYLRSAFPDTFNDRLRTKRPTMRRLLQRDGGALSGIYFLLSTEAELDDSTDYELAVRATMTVHNYEDDGLRSNCLDVLDRFVELFDPVEGVEIVDHELCDEASMSLDDLRFYQRWDVDDLTLRDENAELPPDG